MLGNPTIQLPMVATVGVWFERGHQLEQGDAHLGKNTFSCNLMRTQGLHTSSSSRAHYIIVCIYCNTYKMLIYKYNYIMQCIYIQTVFF